MDSDLSIYHIIHFTIYISHDIHIMAILDEITQLTQCNNFVLALLSLQIRINT